MSISRNFDSRTQNIDAMIDTLISVQKENGIDTKMQEALFNPVTKERLNRFQRERLEKDGVDLETYSLKSSHGCSKCKGKDSSKMSNIERGIFVYSESDLIDEEEGEYVCEYCNNIGYSGKYKPEVCDVCTDCDGCAELIADTCDGCEYSMIFNGGRTYGEVTNQSEEEYLTSEDVSIVEELRSDIPEYELQKPDGKFTIMDY